MIGDILKYIPTATVGKVTEIREQDGRVWVKLDLTNLYYDPQFLIPADDSEYQDTSFKERVRQVEDYRGTGMTLEDLHKMESEVDISEFMPSGGG